MRRNRIGITASTPSIFARSSRRLSCMLRDDPPDVTDEPQVTNRSAPIFSSNQS